MSVRLSVLDLAPVVEGSNAAEALAHSTELAKLVDRLGYERLWVAEHHNMRGVASSSPPVLLAHLAAHTERIRLGSGGLMLPNHAALAVAEQFGMLEALHPGRIDLGIGRAPGTDQVTAAALRRSPVHVEDEFPQQMRDLLAYFAGTHPQITAVPAEGYQPALWLLGSSDYSAQVAGILGLPFSFAHHFAAGGTGQALQRYRQAFQPSDEPGGLTEPYASIGVPVLCAPTNEEARWLAGSSALSFVRFRQGKRSLLPPPEEAAAHEWTPLERELLRQWQAPQIVGDPDEVRDGLLDLVATYGVQELVLTTSTHDFGARCRSFELVAEAFGLAGAGAAAAGGDATAPA